MANDLTTPSDLRRTETRSDSHSLYWASILGGRLALGVRETPGEGRPCVSCTSGLSCQVPSPFCPRQERKTLTPSSWCHGRVLPSSFGGGGPPLRSFGVLPSVRRPVRLPTTTTSEKTEGIRFLKPPLVFNIGTKKVFRDRHF